MKELKDKVVVVTGAASGIGRALAEALALEGAALALVDVADDALVELQQLLSARGVKVSSHCVDVSQIEQMRGLPQQVVEIHGRVDVLVNNAGVSVGALFKDHSVEDADWLLGINLHGVIYGCKFFLPLLEARPEAHIVNVSSMFGLFGMPGQALYSASKYGVRGFSEALWGELEGSAVKLTCVHPGTIRSNLIRATRMVDENGRDAAVALQQRYGMDTDKAAQQIIGAIKSNRKRIAIGWDAKLADALKRMSPVGFQGLIGFLMRRFSKADGAP